MANCCTDLDRQFDRDVAEQKLRDLRSSGPRKETRLLIDAVRDAGVAHATVLDIGSGIGAVANALLAAGASRALCVDASTGYLDAAVELATESGVNDRVEFIRGDFTEIADTLQSSDVVTLDKVICCYPHMNVLVSASADKANRLWAAVYPRDRWYVRIVIAAENFGRRAFRRSEFRAFVHSTEEIEEHLRQRGFVLRRVAHTMTWRIALFERGG